MDHKFPKDLPFSAAEYARRLSLTRKAMDAYKDFSDQG